MATARVRAATAERPSGDERKGRGGLRQQKEEDNSKGRTARAEKSNGDSRKYGPEQRRTVHGFRVGSVSEQRRFCLPECGGMRMEIDEFEPPAQSAANSVVCAARGNRRTTRPAVRRARQGSCYARHNTPHDRTGRVSRYDRRQPAHAGSVRGPRPGSGSPVPGKGLRRPAADRASACAENAGPEPRREKRPMQKPWQQEKQMRKMRREQESMRETRREKKPILFRNRGTRGPLRRRRGRSPWPCRRGRSGSRGRTTPPPSRAEPQRLGPRKCGGR